MTCIKTGVALEVIKFKMWKANEEKTETQITLNVECLWQLKDLIKFLGHQGKE